MTIEKYPIGNTAIEESPLDSIRLKVTDKCPWQCSFCHNEGGRYATDIRWTPEVEEVFNALKTAWPELEEIHYTGGEPTRNRGLAEVSAGLTALGFEVKTTTNGQFTSEEMDGLSEAGLTSFNFSIHSVSPERFLRNQTGRGVWWDEKDKSSGDQLEASDIKTKEMNSLEWAKKQIDTELQMILEAKEKGLDVKVNTVISVEDDIENAEEIFNWAKEHDIPLRLLNDLGNGLESIEAIRKFIKTTDATEVMRKVTKGSSGCSTVYKTSDGYDFVFKQIRDMKLETMCQACPRRENGSCEEQFYGVRLQQGKDGQFYVLLCIQESNPDTQMTLEDFLKSEQFKEIHSKLKE